MRASSFGLVRKIKLVQSEEGWLAGWLAELLMLILDATCFHTS